MPGELRVELLGGCAVSGAHGTVAGAALGGRRARLLLAAVALADGPVPASALADALWGDQRPASWSAALRGAVRALRTALAPVGGDGQAVLATVPTGYRLADEVEVDVRVLAAAARRAAELLGAGRAEPAAELAERAAAAGGDRLLPGETADWLTAHRSALDGTAREARLVLATAAAALGEHDRAVAAARQAVVADPLGERGHRALITALHGAGDRAGAIQAYEACRTVLAAELGIDPGPATVEAYLAVLHDHSAPVTARVPTVAITFIGRSAESTALAAAIARPGVVTVAGPGGVGKTRLAMQVAAAADLPGGRWWVSLNAIGDDELVATATARELGAGADSDPADALARHFAPLGRTLLVLDGTDSVADGAASLVAALVPNAPSLTVLITGRRPVGLEGEQVIALEPLPAPAAGADLAASPPVRLLLDRVRDGGGSLDLADVDPADVAELCRRCAGLPLALELVAAQLTETSVADLLEQLDAGGDDRLSAIARSSYDLLDADEAAVFRRFAVLDGLVPLGFVRDVVAGDAIAPVRVVRILRELGVRGLVTVDRSGPRWRYGQDDDLHHFAADLLEAEGGTAEAYRRSAAALRALLPEDARAAPGTYAERIDAVLGCVRALLGAAVAGRADVDDALEIAFRLHRYWAATSLAEGRFWLGRLLANVGPSPWRRYATYALGYLGYWAGETEPALRDLRDAVAQFSDEPSPYLARALIFLAGLLDDLDRPAEALEFVRRSIAAAEPFGADLYVSAAMGLGSVLSERGDPEAARYATAAVERCRADGSAEQLAAVLATAAMVCWQVGALDLARGYVDEARPLLAGQRRIARVVLLSAAAGVALAGGDVPSALADAEVADEEGTALGVDREMPLLRAVLARARSAAGDGAGAVDAARRGLESAAAMSVGFPLATGLETVALVASRSGVAPASLAQLLATAQALRAAGDRPVPATLRAEVDELAGGTPEAAPLPRALAVELARRLLDDLAR